MKTIKLEIKGMTCPSCSASVNRLIEQLDGIRHKEVNHVTDNARIEFDENLISQEAIIAKINEGHYKVVGQEDVVNEVVVPSCPTCGKKGSLVPHTIFRSMLKPEVSGLIIAGKEHFICLNPACNTAYYNQDIRIDKAKLRREIWYKKGTKRNIICYCNNIDREQIKDAVQHHGLETWEDITSHYRKKVIEKCELLNPTGHCCRSTFDKVIHKFKNEN